MAPPKRWENAIEDVMLENKLGIHKIHLLIIIGLVEAAFNTTLKIMLAQRLMWNTEASGIPPDKWGKRANRSTPNYATRKLITWEMIRYCKTSLASFFDNLASYFDRVLTKLLSIVAMKRK